MIKLEKLQEPEILKQNKTEWTQEYKAAKASKAANLDSVRTRYRHPEIKQQLLRETHEKCAYCESKILHAYPGDVEHINPKSDFEDDIFEWKNLTVACGECNRRKSDNYDDEIGVLNPYTSDPDDHLFAAGSLIFPRPGDVVGRLAFELFELDRVSLIERRKDRLDKVILDLERYASEENELLRKLYKKKIERLKDGSNEYAMVTRAFINDALGSGKKRRRT